MAQQTIATQSATAKRAVLTKLRQLFEEKLLVGLLADLVHVDISNDTLLVDEEDRTFGESPIPQHAEFLRNVTVRPEIGEQRKRESDLLGPSTLRMMTIARNAHNLGICRIEATTTRFVCGKLRASNRSECKREERDNDVLLPTTFG